MGYSGSLEKMTIKAYKNSTFTEVVGKPYTVYINPDKYSHKLKICYNNVQSQGSPGATPDFNRVLPETVSFELVFDGTGVVPSILPGVVPYTGDGIFSQIEEFKKLVFTFNGQIHSPNFVELAWGKLVFRCRLTAIDFTYTLFKPDGTPLRARANASFQGYKNNTTLELSAGKSSPDLTHVVTVKTGDTLPLLCYRIYGTSTHYLEVARVNGLTNVRDLVVGSKVLFPPLDQAPS